MICDCKQFYSFKTVICSERTHDIHVFEMIQKVFEIKTCNIPVHVFLLGSRDLNKYQNITLLTCQIL